MPASPRAKALLFLVITALLWSSGGLFIKLVPWHPLAIAGARSAIAFLFTLALVRRPQWQWSATQLGATVAYAATVILFVTATKLTTAANAILLQYVTITLRMVLAQRETGETGQRGMQTGSPA